MGLGTQSPAKGWDWLGLGTQSQRGEGDWALSQAQAGGWGLGGDWGLRSAQPRLRSNAVMGGCEISV